MTSLLYWLGGALLALVLGLVGADDLRHETVNTAYVADIMEAAKQDELNRRYDAWFNLYEEQAPTLPAVAMK